MEMGEPITAPGAGGDDGHPEDCVFCEESPRSLKGYKTKHGALKDATHLGESIRSSAPEILQDEKVGPIYPLPGGGDPTECWVAKPGILADTEVRINAAAHHLIPGKDVMAKSKPLEQWTCARGGKIKEDIGYSIDGAPNGILLPRMPEIHTKKMIEVQSQGGITERRPSMEHHQTRVWGKLDDYTKRNTAYLIMLDTWLQMHTTHHGSRYDGTDLNYNIEVLTRCNVLADFMNALALTCERSKGDDGKHFPPYALVHKINNISQLFRGRITGRPDYWQSWVSPLAEDLTKELRRGGISLINRLAISRKTRI